MSPFDSPSFWRRMPPAIFGAYLGAIGLGLNWLVHSEKIGVGAWVGWVILGVFGSLYLIFAGLYVAKLMARRTALIEDMDTIPGRLGVSALVLILMLIAAAIAPSSPGLAKAVVLSALGLHAILAMVFLVQLVRDRSKRKVTPVWHLVFVGFIVGTQATTIVGIGTLSLLILGATFLFALWIYGASLQSSTRAKLPPPLRALNMIHIAPVSLFGTTAALLNLWVVAWIMAVLASLMLAFLIVRLKWMTEAGFSPAWAAFTFPMTAYTGMILLLTDRLDGLLWFGAGLLLIITIIIPLIVARLTLMCVDGRLAKATGAANA